MLVKFIYTELGLDHFYQRAQLPLVNGPWSKFDGSGAVNFPVPKFCKIDQLKAF